MKIAVTGMGMVSALGLGVEENHRALLLQKSPVSHAEYVQTNYAKTRFFGEIKHSTSALKNMLDVHDKSATRTSLLGLMAFREAIKNAQLSPEIIASEGTALISGNTVGGMCLTDEMHRDANGKGSDSPYLASYDNGASTIFIQEKYGMSGHINTLNTACSSSANAIMFGAQLIKNGMADRAIVGGVDSLAKFTINGFNALHILSSNPCQPFDENRSGLNLGEGAAYLVLERAKDVAQKKQLALLSGYKNSNDGHHASALSDDGNGPFLAMQGALKKANLLPENIDYINAHGTGTENNDRAESVAMQRLFGKNVPDFSSTKAYTGHTLGAAGAIEAAFSILALKHQEIYPNLHFKNAIPETNLIPILAHQKAKITHVMSNSFGFGGNCSSLVFSVVN